jgi:hypothetical protein
MNEHPTPDSAPPPFPPQTSRLPFWLQILLGFALFGVSIIACLATQHIVPSVLGALAALASFFSRGWRGIGLGFLIAVGLVVLLFVMICGPMLRGL